MPISESYFNDNIEGMKQFPDNFFDIGFGDIEYCIGASKPSTKPNRVKQKNGKYLTVNNPVYKPKDWDFKQSSDEYFTELKRVSKNQIVFGANYYTQLRGGMIVWDKLNGTNDQYGCEIAYQSFNLRTDIVYYMWSGMFQGVYCGKDFKQALVQQGNKRKNEKRIHETQKPVILYEYLLDQYAKEGNKILDTNLGSQSLRIASLNKGFDFWGFENDFDHFNNGNNRFINHLLKYPF